ncbi:MAG TPA: methyltransferase domain-containing protein [Thermoanaerobaculia bacterium]|nr:methyltransferase domain-containing protein [Thermoanaerobaculia bacterium]
MTSLGYLEALALVRRTYGKMPLPARLHVLGRFLSCPFLRVLDFVPPKANVLDIGAGHGIFAYFAARRGARRVVAVEPDLRKVVFFPRAPSLHLVAGYDVSVAGMFDAVTMLDVLYRFPLSEWDALFRSVHERLVPGGVFLIKELDPEHRWKAFWNRTQERISDRIGLTIGTAWSYEPPSRMRERLLGAGFAEFEAVGMGAGYPHAHILYIGRKAP